MSGIIAHRHGGPKTRTARGGLPSEGRVTHAHREIRTDTEPNIDTGSYALCGRDAPAGKEKPVLAIHRALGSYILSRVHTIDSNPGMASTLALLCKCLH